MGIGGNVLVSGGNILQRLTGGIAGSRVGSGILGGLLGGGLLGISRLHGVAVGIGGAGGGGLKGDILVIGYVKGVLIGVIAGLQLFVGIGQAADILTLIVGSQRVHFAKLFKSTGGHVGTKGTLQIGGIGKPALLGIALYRFNGAAELFRDMLILVQTVCLGLFTEQIGLGQIVLGGVLQELVPGNIALVRHAQKHFGHGIEGLVLHGGAGVQPHIAGILGRADAVESAVVVIIHFRGGEILAVHGQSGGAALEHAGVIQQHNGGDNDKHDGDAAIEKFVLFLLGRFLGLALRLGIHIALSGQLLTVLLFSGCTHLFSVLSSDRRNTPLIVKYLIIIQ